MTINELQNTATGEYSTVYMARDFLCQSLGIDIKYAQNILAVELYRNDTWILVRRGQSVFKLNYIVPLEVVVDDKWYAYKGNAIPWTRHSVGRTGDSFSSEEVEEFLGKDYNKEVIPSDSKYLCSMLTKHVKVPDGTTKIKRTQFSGFHKLEDITIPKSVTTIDDGAFKGCTALKSTGDLSHVKAFGRSVYYMCRSLKSVKLPKVMTIKENMFCDCTGLSSVKLADGLKYISAGAFTGCSALETVSIPDSVISIGKNAFCGRGSKSFKCALPSGLQHLNERAFFAYGMTMKPVITVPSGVKLPDGFEKVCNVVNS